MTKHPLDAVESALVDASNALQDTLVEYYDTNSWLTDIDTAIDAALRLVQAEIRYDSDDRRANITDSDDRPEHED
jgi:hypothetical protein